MFAPVMGGRVSQRNTQLLRHPPTNQSRHSSIQPHVRSHSSHPRRISSQCMHVVLYGTMHSKSALFSHKMFSEKNPEERVTVTHLDSSPSRIISHGAPRFPIHPPSPSFFFYLPLISPGAILISHASIATFIFAFSGLSFVVPHVQFVLWYVCRVYNCLLFVLCCLLSVPCCLLFTAAYRCLTSNGHLPLYFARRKNWGRLDRSERGERKRAIRIIHITILWHCFHIQCPASTMSCSSYFGSSVNGPSFSCFMGIDLQLSVRGPLHLPILPLFPITTLRPRFSSLYSAAHHSNPKSYIRT